MSFPQTLADVLSSDGEHAALHIVGSHLVTRKQLRAAVSEVAVNLRSSGIKVGDVVSIAEANTVRHL